MLKLVNSKEKKLYSIYEENKFLKGNPLHYEENRKVLNQQMQMES